MKVCLQELQKYDTKFYSFAQVVQVLEQNAAGCGFDIDIGF